MHSTLNHSEKLQDRRRPQSRPLRWRDETMNRRGVLSLCAVLALTSAPRLAQSARWRAGWTRPVTGHNRRGQRGLAGRHPPGRKERRFAWWPPRTCARPCHRRQAKRHPAELIYRDCRRAAARRNLKAIEVHVFHPACAGRRRFPVLRSRGGRLDHDQWDRGQPGRN